MAPTRGTPANGEGHPSGLRKGLLLLGLLSAMVLALVLAPSIASAQTATGTVQAWGDNGNGQLGDGTNTASNVPVKVSNLSGVKAIAGSYQHSLAVLSL